MKKILITGANSYIGTSFVKHLENHKDYEITVVDMLDEGWRDVSFQGFDSVFHVAGIAHIKETKENSNLYYTVNRDLAVETAKKAKNSKVPQFVFLSTMSVYGMTKGVINENTPYVPTSNYGKSKLEAENMIQDLSDDNFKVAVIRPPMVYGKNCKGNYRTLAKFACKFALFPKFHNNRSMIYIEHLCVLTKLLIDNGESGVFLPQNSEYVQTSEMVRLIAKANSHKIKLTKFFNPMIKIMFPFLGVLTKVFGSLAYDMSLSAYKENYCVCDFEESIRRTET